MKQSARFKLSRAPETLELNGPLLLVVYHNSKAGRDNCQAKALISALTVATSPVIDSHIPAAGAYTVPAVAKEVLKKTCFKPGTSVKFGYYLPQRKLRTGANLHYRARITEAI